MTEAGGATLTDNQGEPTTLAPRTRGPSRLRCPNIRDASRATSVRDQQRPKGAAAELARVRRNVCGMEQQVVAVGPPRRPLPRIPSSRRRGEQCAGGQSGKVWYLAGNRWLRVGDADMYRPDGHCSSRLPATSPKCGQEQPPSPRRALRCGDRWSSSQEIRHPLLDRPSDHRLRLHISSDRASNAMVAGGVVARYLTRVILDVSLARPLAGIAASARGTPGGWRSRRQIWAGPIIRTRSASLEDQEGVGRNHQLDVAVVGWDGGTQVADVAPP